MFITLDDMNRDSMGVYGSKVPGTTPNMDRLAKEGLRFEHGRGDCDLPTDAGGLDDWALPTQ